MIWHLPLGEGRASAMVLVSRSLALLPRDKAYKIEVKEAKRTRSLEQNSYLWMLYQIILDTGGEEMGGWTKDDLHDFFLIHHFGSEVIEGFGMKRHRPLKRSSTLSTLEFMDFVASIQQFMAERGVYLPDPE